jgi:hypothetical protein
MASFRPRLVTAAVFLSRSALGEPKYETDAERNS